MAARHLIPVATTRSTGEIAEALRSFARAGVEVLAIHGGDGTVDAVLTELRHNTPFDQEPVLVLLPGGTTNMTHADVGLRKRGARALGHVAAACLHGVPERHVVARRPLRVARGDGAAPFHGFFFATAAIPRLIRLTRRRLHSRGLTGRGGSSLALIWSLRRLLAGRVEGDPVMHPDPVAYAVDDDPWHDGQAVILLATTLERLILGLRPAPPGGRMGVAGLFWPYRGLLGRLLPFLRGRGAAGGDPGRGLGGDLGGDLGRATAGTLHLRLDCEYTVDGELFAAPASGEITLTAAAPARFLVL
jgi:hypothetical protein